MTPFEPAVRPRTLHPLLRFGIGLLATALLVYLSLWLGAWAFDVRRYGLHEARLRKLLPLHATVGQVVEGLRNEGAPVMAAPADRAGLERAAAEYGGPKSTEVLAKGARWPMVRVFRAADMVYFIYFDQDGVMRDFLCVSR